MSTTDTRAAFEAWMREEYGADDDMLKRPYEDRYFWPRAADAWAGWQAATEAAKAEKLNDDQPAMYCTPDKNGKPLFGKGWMFSPVPQMEATMPLYARPAAKATGTAGELPELPIPAEIHGWPKPPTGQPLYSFDQMREYGQGCAAMARGAAVRDYIENGAEAARQPAPVVAVTRIDTGYGNYLEFERKTTGKSGWLVRTESGDLVRALNPTEVLLVDSALAATAAPVLSDEQRKKLEYIANWMDSSVRIIQNAPDDYGPASQFDYDMGEAAHEILTILAATRSQP